MHMEFYPPSQIQLSIYYELLVPIESTLPHSSVCACLCTLKHQPQSLY